MHLELREGNSIAALPKPLTEAQDQAAVGVNRPVWPLGAPAAITAPPEHWIVQDLVALAHQANRLIAVDQGDETQLSALLELKNTAMDLDADEAAAFDELAGRQSPRLAKPLPLD